MWLSHWQTTDDATRKAFLALDARQVEARLGSAAA